MIDPTLFFHWLLMLSLINIKLSIPPSSAKPYNIEAGFALSYIISYVIFCEEWWGVGVLFLHLASTTTKSVVQLRPPNS